MSRTMMIAAFAATLAASPMALAAPPNTASPVNTWVTATRIQPNQILAGDVKGADVWGTQNKKIATVKDLVIGKDGRVAAAVLDVTGKNVAVPMKDLQITLATNSNSPKKITIDKTQDQLKSAQTFQLGSETAGSGGSAPAAPSRPK